MPDKVRRVVSTEELTISSTPKRRRPKGARAEAESTEGSVPNVLVKKDPSGDVHITVQVSEMLGGRSKASPPSSAYMSPPPNITPSQQELLDDLLRQVNKGGLGDGIKKYIQELLSMSRDSVDALRRSATDSTPRRTKARPDESPNSPSPTKSSPKTPPMDRDLEQDFVRLGELAEVYAQKVNTLVNMYEQMQTPSGSPASTPYASPSSPCVDPTRAPPRMNQPANPCTPRSTRSPPLAPRPAPCPGPAPQPTQAQRPRCPTPSGAPRQIPGRRCVAGAQEGTPTPAPGQRRCGAAAQGRRGGSPQTTQSSGYASPNYRQPRYIPRTEPLTPPPPTRPPTVLRRPPQPMVHHPIPRRPMRVEQQPTRRPPNPWTPEDPWRGFPPRSVEERQAIHRVHLHEAHSRPDLGFSRITPCPIPCPPYTGPRDGPIPPPPGSDRSRLPISNQYRQVPERPASPVATRNAFGLDTIRESPEHSYVSTTSSQEDAELREMMFGGIPGFAVPSREELAAQSERFAADVPQCSPPPSDLEGWFNERRDRIMRAGEPDSPEADDFGQGFAASTPGNFGEDFLGDFPAGEAFGGPEDWANAGFGAEDLGFGADDFNTGMDEVLEAVAPGEDDVDYPADFPPPTELFGPGFDWETANLDQPSFPSSFPGDPLGGSSLASDGSIQLDTSFDTSALQGPVDPERLNAIRIKLANICNDQYREIIEMLQQEATQDQSMYGKLLERATSNPFLDPNATLAPIGSPASSYPGSDTARGPPISPRSVSPGFTQTGRTPPGERRIQGNISDFTSSTRSTLSSGPMVPSWMASPSSPEFDLNPQFAEFDDAFSNMDNLNLLINAHERNPC